MLNLSGKMWKGIDAYTILLKGRASVMWNQDFEGASLVLLLCAWLGLVVAAITWDQRKQARFPPGPRGLPLLGHLRLLATLPHQTLAKLSTRYGHILGLRLGQSRCVVVSSPELAKEFLSTHDKAFANRPPYEFTSLLLFGAQNDLFFSPYGDAWRRHRKICTLELFTAKRLQQFEYVRQEEVGALLQRIAQLSNGGSSAVDVGKCVGEMSTNVISRLLYSGRRTQYTDTHVEEDLPILVREMEVEAAPTLSDYIPWLSLFDVFRRRQMRNLHRRIDKVITDIVMDRKKAMLDNKAPQNDFLDALLSREVADTPQDEDDFLTMNEIKSIIMGMLGGSIHTTALTLEWAMAELLKSPHCLSKLQTEIDAVIGKKQQITDTDIPKLSYLRCVMKEVFRLHPVTPFLIPRFSTQECKVRNYTLPAGTHLLLNVWAIGRDEQVWPNAGQFMPERFESKSIDVKGQNFELLPFGGGRRVCLGLPLGLSIVEVTLANLVNRFRWELPAGETSASMSMEEKTGMTTKRALPTLAIPKLRV